MLKRLALYSLWENDVQQTPGGPTGSFVEFCLTKQVVHGGPDCGEFYAPASFADLSARSTTITMVDYAGWTEAVIQRGPKVLTNHSAYCYPAVVETSFDYVADSNPLELSQTTGGGRLLPAAYCGNRSTRPGVGFPDYWDSQMYIESFSCPNTYEVTL